MGRLRAWALWVAVIAMLLAVLLAVGAQWIITPPPLDQRLADLGASPSTWPDGIDSDDMDDLDAGGFSSEVSEPPGLGIPYLALPLGLMFVILALMALPLLIGGRVGAIVSGITGVLAGLGAVIVGFLLAIIAFVSLITMVSLFLAAPFGTLAYLAIFGSFDVWGAATLTGVILVLQLVAIVFLIVAQQSTLGNKRLVFFLLLCLALTFVAMILHAFPPFFLASITDALAALIIAIVGLVWGLLMLIGGLIGVIKQLSVGRQGGGPLRERKADDLPATSTAVAAPP